MSVFQYGSDTKKEISPGISLEGMMLKLKLQYIGHLMGRVDSLEKTLMLGGIGPPPEQLSAGGTWSAWSTLLLSLQESDSLQVFRGEKYIRGS